MSTIKLVIFDFDGTIADTMSTVVGIYNKFSKKYGYRRLTKKEVNILRKRNPVEVMRILGISFFKIPLIVRKVKKELNKTIGDLRTTVNIRGTLTRLKREGFSIAILTTNSRENVEKFLKSNGLDVFDHIFSGSSILGKSKLIKKALKMYKIKPSEAVYVVDEIRDIWAARRRKVRVMAVGWGYNSASTLKREKPDFFIEKPGRIFETIRKI